MFNFFRVITIDKKEILLTVDQPKAILLNDYLKKGYIKMINNKSFMIISDNKIVNFSILN